MSKKVKLVWKTVKRKVSDLLPYEKNPRKISEKQMNDLKRSLRKYNLAEIPAINLDGKIAAGHQRIKALHLLGRCDEEIEVRIPNRQLTEAEFKDYLIVSNKSGGSWDFDGLAENFDMDALSLAGFEDDELGDIFANSLHVEDSKTSDKEEMNKIKKTSIKRGDMFALGRHRLTCGDALDLENVKKLMGNARADMVDIDPPFNIDLSYNGGVGNKKNYGGTTNDNKTDDEYRVFVKTIMQNAKSVMKPNAHYMFWCDERYVWLLQTLYKELGIDSKRLLVWIKNNSSPTPMVAFNKVTEFVVYGTIGSPYLSKKVTNLNEIINPKMTTGNNLSTEIIDQLNIWMEKRLPSTEYNHPTEKSASLHEKALRRCTRPNDIVLDLTAGGGSILMACEPLKRTAYVNEYEPIFCQLIINKFEKLTGIKAKKIYE